MNHDTEQPARQGIAGLLGGLMGDVRALIRQELRLMRHEFEAEFTKVRHGVVSIGIGLGVAGIGSIFALTMLVYVLNELTPLPLWACYGAVGMFLVVIGGWLLMRGRHLLGSFDIVPRRTLHAIKEDAEWIKHEITSNKI
ncbi:MAG: phage holin family protein [Nitrospira sp.]